LPAKVEKAARKKRKKKIKKIEKCFKAGDNTTVPKKYSRKIKPFFLSEFFNFFLFGS
jgi:hypothetical protein